MSKLVFGVGVYEKGKYRAKVDGKNTREYGLWKGMLRRCYDPKFQEKRPTYKGCSVCGEWLNFQVFADDINGMIGLNEKEGSRYFHLDKDILKPNNKIYSKENCVFVPNSLNGFFTNKASNKGDLPTGVCFHKRDKKYIVRMRKFGKKEHLGLFTDLSEAEKVYNKHREYYAAELVEKFDSLVDDRVIKRLISHSENIQENNEVYGMIEPYDLNRILVRR